MIKELNVDIISKRYKYGLHVFVTLLMVAMLITLWITYVICTDMSEQLYRVSVEAALVCNDTIIGQLVLWPLYVSVCLLAAIVIICVRSHKCKKLLRMRKDAKLLWDYHYNIFELRNKDGSLKFKPSINFCDNISKYTLVIENFRVTLLIPVLVLPEFKDLVEDIRER